jgi:kynureninase
MDSKLEQTLEQARELDRQDPLSEFRNQYWIPKKADGGEQLYFCGNSLGLQPKGARAAVLDELTAWQELAVEGHFKGQRPWLSYNDLLRGPMAEIVGAKPSEVVVMNTLTVNLHLMLISFYRPEGQRRKIVIEQQSFPSDRYAVESQIRMHGLDPAECLVEISPPADGRIIGETTIEDYLEEHGEQVALVLWPGVHYASGQFFDLQRIAVSAHKAGALCGFDLAHAVGNVPLNLRECDADFAVWCTYKYLNSGMGSVAACFVNERFDKDSNLKRLHGWWGNLPDSRFMMAPEFEPANGAEAWALSNPPILAMAPIRVSLELFQKAGMTALRRKSVAMTAYLERLIQTELKEFLEIITPAEPGRRGCQLSLRVLAGRVAGRALFQQLEKAGTVPDWREPDVIRVAPVPMYNRFEDCWQFVQQVKRFVGKSQPHSAF